MSHITNSAHTVNTDAQPFQPDEYIPGYAINSYAGQSISLLSGC